MNDLASADANIQTAMFEVISEGISGGLLVYDKNDLVVYASQQLVGLLPVPKSSLTPGTRIRDFLGAVYDSGGRFAADAAGPRRMLSREDWVAEQIATLWKERAETLERRGTDRWLSFTKRRLSSGYGVTMVRDISEHKKREEQWRADMERVQITEEVLDNLPFPITVKDRNHVFVAVNKAALNFLDLPAEAILGKTGDEIHPPELEARLVALNREILELGETVQQPELVTRPDGSQVVIIANKYRIGKPGRYYLVTAMEDITALVETDVEGRIVSPQGHKAELIRSSLERDQRGITAAAVPSASLSDIVSGNVLVVSDALKTSANALEILKGMGLDASSVVSAEELQLFLELAANSGIRIDLVVIDAAMDHVCRDTARHYGMPVLGIEAGRIKADLASDVLRLLGQTAEADEDIAIESGEEPDHRQGAIDILVAEDNEVNQIVFSQILEGLGYRYAIAADGEEAVQLWQDHSPRLVLMDVTLPKLTGYEAAARIRSLETIDNSVPIIGVLPLAFDRDRDECFASGMNDVILKPISPEALETLFETYLDAASDRTYA